LACALFFSTFLFGWCLAQICTYLRPTSPVPAEGLTFAYQAKPGLRYVSQFEHIVLTHFFFVSMSLFLVLLILRSTYRQYRLRLDRGYSQLKEVNVYEEGDVSYRRALAWFLAGLVAWTALWLTLP
jgi:hypothetical protein